MRGHFHRHIEDVRCDFSLQCCNIFCCCETRFTSSDTELNTSMTGFYQYRQDAPMTTNTRPAHGMVVYSKTPVTPLDVSMKNVEMILVEIFDTQVLFVYKQPLTNSAMLLNALTVVVNEHMQGRDIVILGDFNVDFSKRSPPARCPAEICFRLWLTTTALCPYHRLSLNNRLDLHEYYKCANWCT